MDASPSDPTQPEDVDMKAEFPDDAAAAAAIQDAEKEQETVGEAAEIDTDEQESHPVMHAVTADGQTVPITFNPETGQYMTATGEPVEIQVAEEHADRPEDETVIPDVQEEGSEGAEGADDTSDLSSLAAAAETHSVLNADGSFSSLPLQNIRILNADGSLSIPSNLGDTSAVRIVEAQSESQQIRIINSDGSVSMANTVRAATSVPQQQQQIRIVKMDGGSSATQTQHFRIVNADGSVSNLSGNVRVISSNQLGQGTSGKQFRLIQSASGDSSSQTSPTKSLTLAQAQQLGLLGSPGKLRNIRIAPASGTSVGHQVVIRGVGGDQPRSIQPQVIRIPTSNLQAGSIQQIQVGNKIQYVRVIGSAQNTTPRSQVLTVKGATPMYTTSSLKSGTTTTTIPMTSLKGVKIALPPKPMTMKTQRVILPVGQQVKTMTVNEQMDAKLPTADSSSGMLRMVEHFMARKEERSKENDASSANLVAEDEAQSAVLAASFEPSGVRPRKPCNCTKSQCLKLYCDCFANGEFCNNCNCNNCFNNLDHEEDRQKSIKQCLDRNPNAFKPKIGRLAGDGERRHNKGCNCKRSGCLKNYCECYEAKIPCTDACKCMACKNVEEETGRKKETGWFGHPGSMGGGMGSIKPSLKAKLGSGMNTGGHALRQSLPGGKQPFSFITPEVVEATCQCLLAQAEESERNKVGEEQIEGLIIEEFGRCLVQIIDIANKTKQAGSTI